MDFTRRFYFLFYHVWYQFLILVEQKLEDFADGLATWIFELTTQTMPDNWRDLLLDELAEWEEQGVLVPGESLPVLERWIVKLARHRGTLPVDDPGSESGALTDRFENLVGANRSAVAVVDAEQAGYDHESDVVYQEVSSAYRDKVQQAMELLDPAVAAWWQSPGVDGLLRTFDVNDFEGMSPNHSFCLVENGRAIVVVERQFTAGRTAQAVIWLAHSGLFLFPPDADFNFKSPLTPMSAAVKPLRAGQAPAVRTSAFQASLVAEMAVPRSAALADGTLTVTTKDQSDKFVTWRELLQALAAYRLPPDVRALKILVAARGSGPVREIFISADLLRLFLQLPQIDRQAIMAAATAGRAEAAQGSIARGVAAKRAVQTRQQPSPAQQNSAGEKLDSATELPYNQKRSPAAPATPQPIALAAGDVEKKQPAGKSETTGTDPSGQSRLGIELRNLYFMRAGLGALIVTQLFTGFWEWLTNYHFSFQDDGTIKNAQNSDRARHAFMVENALRSSVPTDGSWHKINVSNINIFSVISQQQYDINIREERNAPRLNQASFWLGGLQEFRGKGSYEVSLRKTGDTITVRFRNMQMVWGWVDEVDAHSAFEYSWLVDSFGQGLVETTIGDVIGDKILNGNYLAVIGFIESGSAGDYKYHLTTKEIFTVP